MSYTRISSSTSWSSTRHRPRSLQIGLHMTGQDFEIIETHYHEDTQVLIETHLTYICKSSKIRSSFTSLMTSGTWSTCNRKTTLPFKSWYWSLIDYWLEVISVLYLGLQYSIHFIRDIHFSIHSIGDTQHSLHFRLFTRSDRRLRQRK